MAEVILPETFGTKFGDIERRLRALENAAPGNIGLRAGEFISVFDDNRIERVRIGWDNAGYGIRIWDDTGHQIYDFTTSAPPFGVILAKGDLIAGLSPETAGRLPVGADGDILYADSTQTTGLRWGLPPSGGGGGFGLAHVGIVNQSSRISDGDCAAIADACNFQLINHLAPAWNLAAAPVTFYPGGAGIPGGAWVIYMVDTFDSGAFGWHSADPVFGHVNVAEILDSGWGVFTAPDGVSVVTSHEVCEMYVDPHVQMLATNGVNRAYSVEVGDPVESHSYSIGGIPMQDFALPSWWDPWSNNPPYSFANNAPGPFTIAPGGYITYADLGAGHQEGAHLPTDLRSEAMREAQRQERVVFEDDLPGTVLERADAPMSDYWRKVAEVPGSRAWRRRHLRGQIVQLPPNSDSTS